MIFSYWIQNSDFTNPVDIGPSRPVESAAQLLELLRGYDWASQNDYQLRCEQSGEPSCPAGLGIVKTDGIILHICPNAKAQTAMIYLHHPVPAKILGFIKTQKPALSEFSDVPFLLADTAIVAFLDDDYERIVRDLSGYTG